MVNKPKLMLLGRRFRPPKSSYNIIFPCCFTCHVTMDFGR